MGFVIRDNILTGYIEEEGITDVVIPDGVQKINGYVFCDCSDLSRIFLPKSVSEINSLQWFELEAILVDSENPYLTSEDGVLYNKEKTVLIRYPSKRKTERFVIPDSVKMIVDRAFARCSYLKEIIIPDGVQKIDFSVFSRCSSLSSIFLPKSINEVKHPNYNDFEEILVDSENPYLTSEDGVLYNKEKTVLIRYPSKRKTERFVIPDSVKMIANRAFEECSYLKEVIIPDGVQEINGHVFYGCSDLSRIFLPKSVSEINSLRWVKLEEILVDSENPYLTSEDGVLYNKEKTELIRYPSKRKTERFVIPDSVKMIADEAFAGCSYLKEIIIPDGIQEIDVSHCSNLSSIFLPKSINEVWGRLFEEIIVDSENPCLTSEDGVLYNKEKTVLIRYPAKRKTERFVIPDSVEKIGNHAFAECSYLKEVIIPDGIQEMNGSMFYYCSSLLRIFLPKSVNEVDDLMWVDVEEIIVDLNNPSLTSEDGVLYDKEKTVLIRYPSKRKTKRFVIPDSVEMIDNDAFCGCSYLQEIIIPDGVTHIGECAFLNCCSLEKLRIPEKCTYLGEDSLVGCDNLQEIIIPDKCQFSPDMPDDALGVGWGLPEKERLKIKIKYKGGVYNYQTYYDVAPPDEEDYDDTLFDEDGNYIVE